MCSWCQNWVQLKDTHMVLQNCLVGGKTLYLWWPEVLCVRVKTHRLYSSLSNSQEPPLISTVLPPGHIKRCVQKMKSDWPTAMQGWQCPGLGKSGSVFREETDKIISFGPLLPPGVESFHLPTFPILPTLPSNTRTHLQLHQPIRKVLLWVFLNL